jgi:hypothetical protein
VVRLVSGRGMAAPLYSEPTTRLGLSTLPCSSTARRCLLQRPRVLSDFFLLASYKEDQEEAPGPVPLPQRCPLSLFPTCREMIGHHRRHRNNRAARHASIHHSGGAKDLQHCAPGLGRGGNLLDQVYPDQSPTFATRKLAVYQTLAYYITYDNLLIYLLLV